LSDLLGPSSYDALAATAPTTATTTSAPVEPRYFDPDEASAFLKERGGRGAPKKSTLAKYRVVGGGPQFAHFGRFPRYREDWLLEWLQERYSHPKRSTSDNPTQWGKTSGAAAPISGAGTRKAKSLGKTAAATSKRGRRTRSGDRAG
jgi:hypothetical protein